MVAFSLFGLSIYWYGIFYFIAFVFGYMFLIYLKRFDFIEKYAPRFFVLLKKAPEDIILYAVLGLLIGGRLGHVFIYDFAYYLNNPSYVFAIWEGGMSFIGGILGVVISMSVVVIRNSFSVRDFFFLTDLLILPTSFGIMIGRIGNFLNQELYGRLVSDVFPNLSSSVVSFLSSISVFHIYSHVDGSLRINTNFLSSFFEGFILFVFSLIIVSKCLKKKSRNIGFLSTSFLTWYSFVRFFLEYLRMDSQSEYVFFFTKSQWFFVLFFLVGVILMSRLVYRRNYMK